MYELHTMFTSLDLRSCFEIVILNPNRQIGSADISWRKKFRSASVSLSIGGFIAVPILKRLNLQFHLLCGPKSYSDWAEDRKSRLKSAKQKYSLSGPECLHHGGIAALFCDGSSVYGGGTDLRVLFIIRTVVFGERSICIKFDGRGL